MQFHPQGGFGSQWTCGRKTRLSLPPAVNAVLYSRHGGICNDKQTWLGLRNSGVPRCNLAGAVRGVMSKIKKFWRQHKIVSVLVVPLLSSPLTIHSVNGNPTSPAGSEA